MTNAPSLHMVQLQLDARRLMALGKMLGLFRIKRHVSTEYLAHCALGELFQEQAPKPFSIENPTESNGDGSIRVLGYSRLDGKTLQEIARGFASPAVYEICLWDCVASKPMPDVFPEGLKLKFELRACPVIRKASSGEKWKKGQEVDVFLSKVWEVNDEDIELNRAEIYREWLDGQLESRGGARVLRADLDRFSIERMTRRTQDVDRKVATIQRPDARFAGEIKVTDGIAFLDLLRKGIGRHKSFGYGMLKIRRA